MKSGRTFNYIQEIFSQGYALFTGAEPYPLRSLVEQECKRLRPQNILDVGCGSGCYVQAGCNYLGIDTNPSYIAYCRNHRPGRFEQMSALQLDLPDESQNMVLCLSVGHHLSNDSLRRACQEMRRVLTQNGLLIFADPVRPIVRFGPAAALLEWLDEGRWFRDEKDYLELLGIEFDIRQKQMITDQFYRTLVLFCGKKSNAPR